MQNAKLYASTDYESTIYSICMHQNLLFFMEKLPKMAVSCSKIEYFGLRQAVAEPPPHFEGAGCKKSMLCGHTDCPNAIYSILMPQNLPFFNKIGEKKPFFYQKLFVFSSLKQAVEPPALPIGGCSLQKSEIRQRTT